MVNKNYLPIIEQIMGFELKDAQKRALLFNDWSLFDDSRQQGKTTAYILNMIFNPEELINIASITTGYNDMYEEFKGKNLKYNKTFSDIFAKIYMNILECTNGVLVINGIMGWDRVPECLMTYYLGQLKSKTN